MVKGFGLPVDYVLYEMSYANILLYSATLPSYRSPKKRGGNSGRQEIINGDDPRNNELIDRILENS